MPSWRRRIPVILAALAVLTAAAAYFGAKPLLESLLAASVPRIEQAATALLGSEVRFDRIEPRLDWARPEFRIINPRVEEDGRPVLSAASIRLEVDALSSFREKRLRIGGVTVERPSIQIQERPPGKWVAMGLRSVFRSELPAGELDRWVTPEVDVRIIGAQVALTPWEGTPSQAHIEETSLRLVNGSEGLRASVAAKLGEGAKGMKLSGELRRPPGSELALTLRAEGATGRALLELIPAPVLGEELKSWLTSSLKGGRIRAADLEYSGSRLSASVALRDVELDYRAGWPALSARELQLSFDGSRVLVDVPSATWSGMSLAGLRGEISDVSLTPPVLQITGEATAPGDKLASFLSSGPIKESVSGVLSVVVPKGTIESGFRLRIPLAEGERPSGAFDLRNGAFRWLEPAADFERATGTLGFSPGKVTLKGINARAFGHEFTVDGTHETSAGRGATAEYTIAGSLPWEEARRWDPRVPSAEFLDGSAAFVVKLGITGESVGDASARWVARGQSELTGTAIALPEPLLKDAAARWSASFEAAGSGRSVTRAGFSVGRSQGAPELTLQYRADSEGRGLTGRLKGANADVSEWIEAARGFPAFAKEPAPEPSATPAPLKLSLTASVDELSWKDLRFESIEGRIENDGPRWKFGVKSLAVEGSAEVSEPLPANSLQAKFTKLILPKFPKDPDAGAESDEGEDDPADGWDLSRWPSLDITIDRLRVGPQLYGELKLEAKQTGSMIRLDRLDIGGPELEIHADRGECGYASFRQCSLAGTMKVTRTTFPTRLKSLQELELRLSEFRYKLFWPGGPEAFAVRRLSGALSGTLREGALKGVTSSAMKIFNMLSFETEDNDRRISRFYKASVRAGFKRGSIELEPFTALFGSVWFRLSGPARFKDKRLEMKARVKLSVPDIPVPGLPPLEGAWSGEPEPEGFLGHSYAVEGSWDDPSVSLIIF